MTNLVKQMIKESLDELALKATITVLENTVRSADVMLESTDHNHFGIPVHHFERRMGRIAIVNRIRNGSLQMNKRVDVMGKGFKLMAGGQVVRMQPREILNRKRAAKRASRKRQMKMAQIVRKRMRSMQRRNSVMGYFK